VATGINGSTPIGAFKIINKLKNPVWYKAGAVVPSGSPENILGSRWMGISLPGYGIHGTTEPETIGKHITAGCIRMEEPHIRELYAVLPIGTEVTIID
jgi:lipoprotein-anchoring transpeptidase ErfK/SrfK